MKTGKKKSYTLCEATDYFDILEVFSLMIPKMKTTKT